MKYYATILMLILFAHFSEAQNSDYNKLWKQVEAFEREELPKSALQIVEQRGTKFVIAYVKIGIF